jgi:hypothetical protein
MTRVYYSVTWNTNDKYYTTFENAFSKGMSNEERRREASSGVGIGTLAFPGRT